MDLALQAKLLRILESRTFKRVGGTRDLSVDVRVIAATNRNLEERIREKTFREDLYYRLNVIPIDIPPLRERREDIIPLAERFLADLGKDLGKEVRKIEPEAVKAMEEYDWPGNVRELKNIIERAMILSSASSLGAGDLALKRSEVSLSTVDQAFTLDLEEMEGRLIGEALERSRGNQSGAAKLLGISRDTLRYRMKKHGLL